MFLNVIEKGYFRVMEEHVCGWFLSVGTAQTELIAFLQKDIKNCNVVVMPDFFLDRLITLNYSVQQFTELIADKIQRKGGSIDQIPQIDQNGGNAVNVTSALAMLGAIVTPILCTSKLGLEQIRRQFGDYPVDISHVKVQEKASITTALEFGTQNGKTNVMFRDVGSLADFSSASLNESDYKLIETADYVCLFNWAGTRNFGTELAKTVFHHTKTRGKGKTYFDTADPNSNQEKMPELMRTVLKTSEVDILSLNENEAFSYASMLSDDIPTQRTKLTFNELAIESARLLAKHLHARIDLHTTTFSATVTTKQEIVVPAFNVNTLRATGAGDAWDAGNIMGDANALRDEARLALANAVSAYYLSDPEGMHPRQQKLLKFIRNTKTLTNSV
jgi:sugar/nucleoside kinase (ribokinase family)